MNRNDLFTGEGLVFAVERGLESMQVDIELSDLGDADRILELQKACYESEAALYDDYSIPPLTETIESMRAEFERHVILKAVEGGVVIGSVRARVEEETCHIGRLIVHPSYQDRGIGKQLAVNRGGIRELPGGLSFSPGNRSVKNIAFYKNLGYQEYRREPLNEKVTLVYMEKLV